MTYVRRCVEHNQDHECRAWKVIQASTGRVAAVVTVASVRWEPWFEARFEEIEKHLFGRRPDGLTGGKGESPSARDKRLTGAARRAIGVELLLERIAQAKDDRTPHERAIANWPKGWRRKRRRAA